MAKRQPYYTDSEFRSSEPPKIWDNTMLTMLDECPRKLYFFLRGFEYAGDATPVYFTWGRAFHAGLLRWYTLPQTEWGSNEHTLHQMAAIQEAVDLWMAEAPEEKGTNTLANLKNKLTLYFDEYPNEEWSFVPKGGEAGWVWPLNSHWELGGAMDGYVHWPGRGMFVLEHKTTGEYLYPGYIEQYHFSRQITQYFWYLTKLLGATSEEKPYGALVNMITKNIRTARSKWKYPEFDRVLIKKAPWELEEFEEDVTNELTSFERYWNDWYWPRKGMKGLGACSGGTGKAPCLYRGICRTPLPFSEVEAKDFVGLRPRERAWEPWNRLEES